MRRIAFALALACVGPSGRAAAIVCTASDVRVLVRNFELEAPLPDLTGYAFPIEIVGASGSVRVDLSGVPDTTFDLGFESVLHLTDAYFGTIDAAGNVVIPDVDVRFTVVPIGNVLVETTAVLTTGIGAQSVSGVPFVTEGSPLDFTTGVLRLAGQGLIPVSPIGSVPVLSGLSITCQLDQIPSPADLPAGPTLSRVVGKGRYGKSKNPDELPGDTLTIKAVLRPGAVSPVLPDTEILVRVTAPGQTGNWMLTQVPAGILKPKGKKLRPDDAVDSAPWLIQGNKRAGAAAAAVRAAMTIVPRKKTLSVQLTQAGLDLCQLPAGTVLTVQIGSVSASAPITVRTRGRGACGS